MTENPARPTPDPAMPARLSERLRNADISWDGTLIGLVPTVTGDAAQHLLAIGAAAIPALLGALEDENKFVAAHVLLTLLSGVEHHSAPWNGLTIELSAGAAPHIDARQRFDLARRWRDWQQTTPHPRSLPS